MCNRSMNRILPAVDGDASAAEPFRPNSRRNQSAANMLVRRASDELRNIMGRFHPSDILDWLQNRPTGKAEPYGFAGP